MIRGLIAEHPEVIDLVYADLIRGLRDPDKGRKGMMTAEQVFKVLLIKQMNGYSYDTLRFHLMDSRCYRSFCGFGIADKIPSDKTIQRDIKRISAYTLEKIHCIFIGSAEEKKIERGRTVRVDCTVSETNIHPPTDASLLWDCVRVLSRESVRARKEFGIKARDHRRRAKRYSMRILNAKNGEIRKQEYRKLVKVTKKAVTNAKSVLKALYDTGNTSITCLRICTALEHYLSLTLKVIEQTERRVFLDEKLKPGEKLVSIFEPHTNIIVKERRDTHYGHKLALTGGKSGLILDLVIEDGNPSDAMLAEKMVLRQQDIWGRVPRQAAFDGGFASKKNLLGIKELGVKDVAFAKKRGLIVSEMTKSTWVYKKLRDFRAGIEGMISFLKRSFGLNRCTWKGYESFKAYAWSSVITANLLLMARRMLV